MGDDLQKLRDAAHHKLSASGVGPLHALWDVIGDADEHLKSGRPQMSREGVIRMLAEYVDEQPFERSGYVYRGNTPFSGSSTP